MRTIYRFIVFLFLAVACVFPSFASAAIMTDSSKQNEFALVNDYAGIMTKEQVSGLNSEIDTILSRYVGQPPTLRYYVFTTNSKYGGLKGAEEKLIGSNVIPPNIAPVVFIYDSSADRFEFLVDERVDTLVSHNYLLALVGNNMKNGLNADEITEISVRASTILQLAAKNSAFRQQHIPSLTEIKADGEIKVVDFTSKYEPTGSKKDEPEEDKKPTKKPTEDNDMTSILFLAALISGIIIIARVTKKKQNSVKHRR